jgi:hypothetical protein
MRKPTLGIALGLAAVSQNQATAQVLSSAIRLEPLPAIAASPAEVDVTTVTNHYGRCGSAVVQVIGVEQDNGDFFSVDAASESANVVVIAPGGRSRLSLRSALSDYNGVACVGIGANKHLLVWSTCSGTVCGGMGYSFTVVDVRALRILAGGRSPCNASCAQWLTGSRLPLQLDQSLH